MTEPEILFGDEPLRPDVAGWHRDRLPTLPDDPILTVLPDWICAILSSTNATNDTIKKKRVYHRFQIRHYWVLDPRDETLTVYRFSTEGYLEVLAAQQGERVRAEPFDAIDLSVGALFDTPDDDDP